MKSFAVASLLATVVVAQQASLIPTGISTPCSTFLNKLNNDTQLAGCASSLVTATKDFAPNGGLAQNASTSAITTALNTICATSTMDACPASYIRTQLAAFQAACPSEITSSVPVITLYDTLYALTPLRTALCAKDTSGTYCPISTAKNTTSHSRRDDASNSTFAINPTTWAKDNLAFLLIKPSTDASTLCTPCTKSVLTAYVNFEGLTPYSPGLANSAMMSGQSSLWQSVTATCGASFMSDGSGNAVAGGISNGKNAGAAVTASGFLTAAAVAAMGMAVML